MLMLLFHVDETRDALANSQPSRLNQETSRLGFMKAFRVDGQAPFGRLRQKFSLDVVASSKADAEHVCTRLSAHATRQLVVQSTSIR